MWGANSFATYLIVCPTCFLLGILFANWPYDFPLLWTSSPLTEATISAIEAHYTTLFNAPPLIPRVLHFIMLIALIAFCVKLYAPSESNMLFDGASLALFMVAVIMWGTNIIKGMRTIDAREYGVEVGRVETMQVVAATNTICALVLFGVLTLQAGQWYAEKKEKEEVDKLDADAAAAVGGGRTGGGAARGESASASGSSTAGAGSVGRRKGETVTNGGKKKKV